MHSTIKERLFWWGVVPALAAVLVGLAVLQYHWSDQISAATRSEMQANLERSLMGFRQDLTRELTAVCGELRSATGDSGKVRLAEFNRRFQRWQQTAAHPALVKQVYLWRNVGQGSFQRLDPARGEAGTADWPADLEALRHRLGEVRLFANRREGELPRHRPDRFHFRSDHRPPDPPAPWFIDESVPALVYPLHEPAASKDKDLAITWIIVELNAGVLEKEIFPELVQRYFRGPARLDYRVAIFAGNREHALYSTDAGFAKQSDEKRDAALYLFGSPFRRPLPGSPAVATEAFGFFRMVTGAHLAQLPPEDKRTLLGLDRFVRLEPLRYAGDGGWQIVVQHPSGSLEAAVDGLRRRHLAMSFGVLMLLAITMALVLIASQRARNLAALQMNFVAGVSHELRTPLAVISSAAENIVHGVVVDQAQMQRYGASILKQARQLTHLVEQVLVFAATQRKAGHYSLRAVKVGDVIDAALESTTQMANAAGVAVERRVDPDLPPVLADFTALSQCLQNLITNAIKYGGEGGWLGISADAGGENGAAREVEITVGDKGIGISTAEIKHIFEPFYRSPSVAGSNVHGTGLGLPLARTVIESLGGRLTVESQPGQGSSFTIHLPAATEQSLPAETSALETLSGERARTYP